MCMLVRLAFLHVALSLDAEYFILYVYKHVDVRICQRTVKCIILIKEWNETSNAASLPRIFLLNSLKCGVIFIYECVLIALAN